MQPIILAVLVGMVGGILVAVQASLAGIISDRLGLIENAFIVFGIGFFFPHLIDSFWRGQHQELAEYPLVCLSGWANGGRNHYRDRFFNPADRGCTNPYFDYRSSADSRGNA